MNFVEFLRDTVEDNKTINCWNIFEKVERKEKKMNINIIIKISSNITFPHKHIILSNNSSINFIENDLNNLGIKTVTFITYLTRKLVNILFSAGFYSIHCDDNENI